MADRARGTDEVVELGVLHPSRVQHLGPPRPQRLVELGHVIEPVMITVPGQPGPEITPHLTRPASRARYASGTEFAIDRITLVGNSGTHFDTPLTATPAVTASARYRWSEAPTFPLWSSGQRNAGCALSAWT
jgi:hypothetical protein